MTTQHSSPFGRQLISLNFIFWSLFLQLHQRANGSFKENAPASNLAKTIKEEPTDPKTTKPPQELLLKFPHLKIPVIKERSVLAYFHVMFDVYFTDNSAIARAKQIQPLLCDRIFVHLYGVFYNLWNRNKIVKSNSIQKRIHKVIEEVIGKGSVISIFPSFMYLKKAS